VVCRIPVKEIPDSIVVGAGSLWVTYDSGFSEGSPDVLTRIRLRPPPCST
jgi:hypothetical protein